MTTHSDRKLMQQPLPSAHDVSHASAMTHFRRFAASLVVGFAGLGLGGCPANQMSMTDGNTTGSNTTDSAGSITGSSTGTAGSSGTTAQSADLTSLRVFPADNPWNQDISALPVHSNSANYLASMGLGVGLHPDFGTEYEGAPIGIPYNIVDAGTPRSSVEFDYADESDAGPYPIPKNPLIEGGPNGDGDRHIIMVDPAAKKLYEIFYAVPQSDGSWAAGAGAIFDLTSNDLRPAGWTSADAAGLPIFPGLVRYDEVVEKGEITHALRFTVSKTQAAYIPPATHFASTSTDPNRPPMGLRVRLRADFDISGFTPNVQVILRAMKKYGMLLADNGSNWFISGAPDPRWDDDELRQLGQVKGADFEVVQTGDLVTK